MIIGLLGKKRVGKDTVADYLVNNHNFRKETMATPLKDACGVIFGFNNDQLYGDLKETDDSVWNISPRKILQYLGTDIFRKDIAKIIPDIGDKFWIKCMENRINTIQKKNPKMNIVISDIRFDNEVDMVHKLNGIVIKIDRPSISNTDQHESEANIDLIKSYDLIITNDKDYTHLYDEVDSIIK
ncbi:MAG: deoxynucleoside monophosphate kinase [Homavirus sp.]|uniref:Deoxynucleoside monophosphate kinase n=1 Tax=Homavirus sp. TaxID=2487769 RepID=A0A3G5A4W5_9VIRU|nr:MAG: deoxynucleoside monophosphate kinase [Homavirus sp.]